MQNMPSEYSIELFLKFEEFLKYVENVCMFHQSEKKIDKNSRQNGIDQFELYLKNCKKTYGLRFVVASSNSRGITFQN